MSANDPKRSIGAGADSAALLRAALATDLARTGRLRFGDAADGVLQMRRPIGQRGLLDRQPTVVRACEMSSERPLFG